MDVKYLSDRTPLAHCVQTEVQDDFLEALLVNKRRVKKYENINPIVCNGHGRGYQARQVLSYLMRKSFGIVRRPGTYDIRFESKHFQSISSSEIAGAVNDIRRICDHTQKEMEQHFSTVRLVRGIGGVEAAVCAKLLDEIDSKDISFYFQTITFFNHIFGAFSRDIKVTLDCPVNWIWASAYTLKDLELPGSDEEFMVVCRSDDGLMEVPKRNFEITSDINPIHRVISSSLYDTKHCPQYLHQALSALMTEGFEPDDYERTIARYGEGPWEKRLMKVGIWLDQKIGGNYKNRVFLKSKRN